ncbi:MAG TPA: MFS transporter, partial [Gaiellaceae bacterium]|nr:MFS transporter [Gaiellaceae bacterium]
MPGEATAAPARASILRSRPLAALLAAEVLSTTGSQMTWLALPWFVLVTSGSKEMAFVIATEAAGYALFGIPSGSLLERLGPQRTMRFCDAVRAPLMLLVPVLHWSGDLTLPILLVLAFVLGIAGTPYGAAQRIVVAEILDDDAAAVERANAVLQGATRITMLCGPALGGVLIALVGAPVVLVLDAASYVVSFALVTLFVPVARAVPEEETAEDARGLLAGVRYLLRDPLMRGWTAAIVLGDASFSVIFVAIPVIVVAHYGADPRLAGAFLASWGVGAVALRIHPHEARNAPVGKEC